MNLHRMAKILYNLSLDMDYADSLEYKDEEIKCIAEELEILKQNKCSSTLQMLEMIALKNEDMEHWKEKNNMSLREDLNKHKISLKQLLEMYDNWNGITKVNDNELNTILEDGTIVIYDTRKDLLQREVVAFGFYDGVLTVRIK